MIQQIIAEEEEEECMIEDTVESVENDDNTPKPHHTGPIPDNWIANKRRRLQSFCKRSKTLINSVR